MNTFTLAGMFPRYMAPVEDDYAAAMASGFDTDDDQRDVAPYAESQPEPDEGTNDAGDEADDAGTDDTDTTDSVEDAGGDDADAGDDDAADTDADDDSGDGDGSDTDDTDEHRGEALDDPAAQLKQQYPHLTADDIARAIREANRIAQEEAERNKPKETPKPLTMEDFLTEEEKQVLKTYDEEWGEVSRAEQIRTQALVKMALAEAKKEWGEALSPLVHTVQQTQQTSFRDTVLREHPDADQVVGNLEGWIVEQPRLLRAAYEQAYANGSAEDIIELLSAYKQATGTGAAQPPASTPTPRVNQQQQQRQQQKRATAAKAAKATAAVTNSQRGDAPTAVDPDDFSAAFGEALKVV